MTLEDDLLTLLERGVDVPLPDAEFDRLARAEFAYQFERNRPYSAYCQTRGKNPESISGWQDIPALPTDAFKAADLTTAPDAVSVVYHTSGTQGAGRPGRHLLPNTRLYDASLLPNFQAHLLPDRSQIRVLICGPSAQHFPHSSLGHMNSKVLDAFGTGDSGIFWTAEGPRFADLATTLAQAETDGAPVCLLGTAFGFVHFLDYLAAEGCTFRLPPGSRIMDTGGYKGRSREVPQPELYGLYGERLGVARSHIVNEYGMTELGSQFYDRTLRDHLQAAEDDASPDPPLKVPPPWVRTLVVDPETLKPLPESQVGLLRHIDLANLHSVVAIQTDDLGVWSGDGFRVLGRASGAEPRGCSLAVEDFVAAQNRE